MDLSSLGYSYLLIVFALLIAYKEGVGNEREVFFSSLRTLFQLLLLGYLLRYLLTLTEPWEMFAVLLVMSLFSSFIAYERVKHARILLVSFFAIGTTTLLTIGPLLAFGVLKLSPTELIPFGGLIVGNTLNSVSLAFDRFVGELKGRIDEVEAKVALGAPLRVAMEEVFVSSIRASMIPKINFMKTAGIVHIPGVAVGMLMAGKDPMEAILLQIVILYSLVFAGLVGSVLMLKSSCRLALILAKR